MTTYAAHVTREGKWWMIEIPELDGLTQARRLSDVETAARELIAVTLDIPLSEAEVNITKEIVGLVDVSEQVRDLNAAKTELAALEKHVRHQQVGLARSLAQEKVPVRDIGTALGVSFQRAQQLVG